MYFVITRRVELQIARHLGGEQLSQTQLHGIL